MNKYLTPILCGIISLFLLTTAQAQSGCTSLYKYDTLVVGLKGSGMHLSSETAAASSYTITINVTWATVSQVSGGEIAVNIVENNDNTTDRVGYISILHGACRDTIVLLQPGINCAKGMEGTEGTDFWVAFMENIGISLVRTDLIATANQDVFVTISNPLIGWSQTYTVLANTVETFNIPDIYAYNSDGEVVSNKTLHVTSTGKISLYANNYENLSSDATNVLPIEALGDEYYSISYNSNTGSGEYIATPEEFMIIATEDNTLVTIVPAAQTESGRPADDPFTIRLNKGQNYMVKAYLGGDIEDSTYYKSITGTYIKGNKPIAVFSGHKRAKISCPGNNSRDNLFQQLAPVNLWGTRYAVVSTGQPSDLYRVMAALDNTVFTINGVTQQPLGRGKYRDYSVNQNAYAYIESDKPITVALFAESRDCLGESVSVGDPFMLLLNPVENEIPTVTYTALPSPVITHHYTNIIVRKTAKALTTLTNKYTLQNVPLTFTDIPGADYAYARVEIGTNAHLLQNSVGFTAYVYGYGSAESYGYSVGARFNRLAPPAVPDTSYCIGDTPKNLSDYDTEGNFIWYDTADTLAGSPATPSFVTDTAAEYVFYVSRVVGCSESPRRKVTIKVHALPVVTFIDTTVCNTSAPLDRALPSGGTYTGIGCVGNDFIPNAAGAGTHTITYTYKDANTCVNTATADITVMPLPANPVIHSNSPASFCLGESVTLYTDSTDAAHYQWHKNGQPVTDSIYAHFTANTDGTYTLTIRGVNGCAAADTSNAIVVAVFPLPGAPVVSPAGPVVFCASDSVVLTGTLVDGVWYQWFLDAVLIPGADTNRYVVRTTGEYKMEIYDKNNCVSPQESNKVVVTVYPLPANPIIVSGDALSFCDGGQALLEANAPTAQYYQWYRNTSALPAATHSTYTATVEGTYTLSVLDANNCTSPGSSDPVVVIVYTLPADPVLSAGGPTAFCAGDSVILTAVSAGATAYRWMYNNAPWALTAHGKITVYDAGSYTVDVIGVGGCLAANPSNQIVVTVHALPVTPVFDPPSMTAFCEGLSVTLSVNAAGALSYEWYKGNDLIMGITGNTYTVFETGIYYVKAVGAYDCYSGVSDEVIVTVHELPVKPVIMSKGPPFYMGLDYTLKVQTVEYGVVYDWYKNSTYTGVSGESYALPLLSENDAGIYYVDATNIYNCVMRSDDLQIAPELFALFIPNVFTPNGDGINDNFRIVGLEEYDENELTILNKRGRTIYDKKNYANEWYGDNHPEDIYYYRLMVKTKDGLVAHYKGYLHLKRK